MAVAYTHIFMCSVLSRDLKSWCCVLYMLSILDSVRFTDFTLIYYFTRFIHLLSQLIFHFIGLCLGPNTEILKQKYIQRVHVRLMSADVSS